MSFERRSKQRLQIGNDRNVRCSLGEDGELAGRVIEMSGHGLVVSLPAGSAAALAEELGDAALVVDGRRFGLAEVRVRRLDRDRDGFDRLALGVEDDASRATLWRLCDRLKEGSPADADAAAMLEDPGQIPDRGHYTEQARRNRLRWMRETTGAPLESVEDVGLDPPRLTGNIENLVGSVELPVGLAGPLLFRGQHARGYVTAPLATTEGALVASASRGAKAITRAGGVVTRVLMQRMNRAPMWEFADLDTACAFVRWVGEHLPEIRHEVGLVSRHARLIEVEPIQIGRIVNLRFIYETGDAAGQNMVTACTWRACRWINDMLPLVPGLQFERCTVEGNMSGDKKVNYLSFLATRGTRVTAECQLDAATLHDVLKVTPEQMFDLYHISVRAGLQAGFVGHTINVANTLAAFFVATGQDIACVQESASGIFSLEHRDGGLYASLLLPSLIVGTVGGGTHLPNPHDYLEMMGCAGPDRAHRFAEVVTGFALALDLSTLAAIAGGQFAEAHERLGRNRPVEWFTEADLTPEFFRPMLADALEDPELEVVDAVRLDDEMGSSIVSALSAHVATKKLVGLVPMRLMLSGGRAAPASVDIVVKAKALDDEVVLATQRVASLAGGSVMEAYSRWVEWLGFRGARQRELALYRAAGADLRSVMPRVYGVHEDAHREASVIVMERLDEQVVLKDTAGDVSGWERGHVDAALGGIALAHAAWLGREEELSRQPWLGPVIDGRQMQEMSELWLAVAEHNAAEYPEWIDEFTLLRIRQSIADIPEWWGELEAMPRTLVHNDFNPRNIALRRDGLALVAYDWELATLHVPQRDLAELLAFVLPLDVDAATVDHHVEHHRAALADASGTELCPELWRRGYRLALRDFVIHRLGLYMLAHTQRSYDFLERVVATVKRLIEIENERQIALGDGRPAGAPAWETPELL